MTTVRWVVTVGGAALVAAPAWFFFRPRRAAEAVEVHAEAVDPVCAMTISPRPDTPTVERAGTTWWFCSIQCRDTFTAAHSTKSTINSQAPAS